MSGSVSTRAANRQAERVTASGQLRLPGCWGALSGEVEDQPLARDRRAQAQLQIALGRLEHVLCLELAVGQRRQAGARAALGVVEHRAKASRRPLAPTARASSRRRSAPMRLAASCARRSASRSPGWRIRADSSLSAASSRRGRARSRRPLPPACGCPRASTRGCARRRRRGARGSRRTRAATPSTSTGVMTVMSGRCVPPANGSFRTQDAPLRVILLAAPPAPPRASSRGARGCARPASPSRRQRRTGRSRRRGAP